jgi:hypothetical protein
MKIKQEKTKSFSVPLRNQKPIKGLLVSKNQVVASKGMEVWEDYLAKM